MPGPLDYSTTAASNTSVGGVSVAEGMQAGLMNDALRAAMADTRKWQLDWSGIVTAGAGNAYTITTNQGVTAYADGMRFSFRADRNNTGAATLNVDSRGAKALRKLSSGALAALGSGDLVAEAVYDVVYDLSSDVFVIVGFAPPTISAFAQTLLDDADAAAARTTLGVRIGTDVQAYDASLASLSGLTLAAGDILYATGADTLVNLAKGAAGQQVKMNSGATAPEWGGAMTFASPVASTSGTEVLLTGVPSWTRKVTVFLLGVSTNGTDDLSVRLGTSAGYIVSGYTAVSSTVDAGGAGSISATATFPIFANSASGAATGVFEFYNVTGTTWVGKYHGRRDSNQTAWSVGSVDIGAALTRIRVSTTGGTNTFDAGSVILAYQ